jgi:hypothetical protein
MIVGTIVIAFISVYTCKLSIWIMGKTHLDDLPDPFDGICFSIINIIFVLTVIFIMAILTCECLDLIFINNNY